MFSFIFLPCDCIYDRATFIFVFNVLCNDFFLPVVMFHVDILFIRKLSVVKVIPETLLLFVDKVSDAFFDL